MKYELIISSGEKAFSPAVVDGIEWTTSRSGAAGKLTFSIIRNGEMLPDEGNKVTLKVDGCDVFCGYIFALDWNKEGIISVVAFDQLRYFKNKETYIYSGRTAESVLKMIVADFGMQTGEIADTGYVIPSRVEDNKQLFDIIGNAIDLTYQNTGRLYVMYDDFGKIALKDTADMIVKNGNDYLFFDENSAEDYEFSSDINNTFNKIKLVRENKKAANREVFCESDDDNIRKWGTLQYYAKLSADENGKAKAQSLLKLYNSKSRSLKLKNAVGDVRVRGGCMVGVSLEMSGIKTKEFMLVESVSHTFRNNEHLMIMDLRGGDING